MRLRFDPAICTGCQACQMACLDQRDILPAQGEAFLCRVESAERDGTLFYRFVHCIQCGKCVSVCPSGCLSVSKGGVVLADGDRCLGCRQCEAVCPMGVLSFREADGTVQKCDLCLGRVSAGLLPACVHTCPTGALILDLEE